MRDKLIGLIKEARDIGDRHCEEMGSCAKCHELGYDIGKCGEIIIADHLIANGVTMQQWIPVSERLPEIYTHVLVHIPWEKPFTAVHEGWRCPHGDWYADGFTRTPREVTHWMPLPEPPKEGE